MKSYRVTWEIDLEADTPRLAAERALRIHRNPRSIATIFTVTDENGEPIAIDLSQEDGQ